MNTKTLVNEIAKTLRRPSRVAALLDPNARTLLGLRMRGIHKGFSGRPLSEAPDSGFVRRDRRFVRDLRLAPAVEAANVVVGRKTGSRTGPTLKTYDTKFREQLRLRLQSLGIISRGMTALCLGHAGNRSKGLD